MEAEDFSNDRQKYVLQKEMIQPYFDKWLRDPELTHTDEVEAGKVLINSDYTRIPETCYKTLFDPNQTVILSRSAKNHLFGIPVETLKKYEETNELISDQLVRNAQSLFRNKHDHPVFSNEYFQQTFLKRIPLIVKTISTVCNFFEHLNISAIVVGTTEDMVSRVLAIVGSMRGIKSICLQHGILMGEEAFLPVFTDQVAVYGEYEKKWYLDRGLFPERIAEIGHPKYDEIFTHIRGKGTPFYRRFNLDPAKYTLLVITGPNIDPVKFTELIKNILDHSEYQLIIKPHPWEIGKGKCEIYLDLEKKYQGIKVFTSRENYLYELISHVDGVAATLSTVVLESILFDKPVFIYNFIESNREYDYFAQLGELVQSDPKQLTEIIGNYYKSDEYKKMYDEIRINYLADSYNGGSSGEKLIQLINRLNV
ncbi:hypothetical protein [Peribacillus sp. NPDC056705]|uniref:hypothetical protein n=1 Tax=Peribacillus sp. NPDC056705 TaxID=3345918 RepID=UPI003749B93B